jgi:hypothetical protein
MSDFNSNAKPVSPDTLIDDLNPSRFLKPSDLTERWHVQSLAVTILRIAEEDTWPSMNDIDPNTRKPKVRRAFVLYFKNRDGGEFPRGMLISAGENVTALKAATGAKTVGEMIGKRITIIVGEFRHKPVLRISPETPAAPAAPAVSTPKNNGNAQPKHTLASLQELIKTDVIVAYSEITKMAGLDQPTAQAILRECLGDFETAFNKITEQYKEILN